MTNRFRAALASLLLAAAATHALAETGELRVEIQQPGSDLLLTSSETSIEIEGGASVFGGVRYLDLLLVLDSSKSLRRSDPLDYRSAGAIGLVEALPAKSDIQIGVVDFDWSAELVAPLSADRAAVARALRGLDQSGSTDLAAGIREALKGFRKRARPDSSRVILLFTDGKSDGPKAREAMEDARRMGVAIHALLLGDDDDGAEILRQIAGATGGSFVRVTDPALLPEVFLSLRTTGVERVTLRVNDSAPIQTELSGGTFRGRVPLSAGENLIVATAASLDGRTRDAAVTVVVSGPLEVTIASPLDGTLLTRQLEQIEVEGSAGALGSAGAGVRSVVLRVGDSPPFATTLEAGRFRGRVLVREGPNHIVATAASVDGRTAEDAVTVTVRPPGCAELQVAALRNGQPALSVSDRAVEIVVDASNSMWGQIEGRAKIGIAKEILLDALDWLPSDLALALRVYGHQHDRERRDCRDSELLVSLAPGSRQPIREAIARFRPRGQTPLAYSLQETAGDLEDFSGERAVVLVTDGIESCGGDPVAAARALKETRAIPVHVIGFGLGDATDADAASLRAIADASGGRFVTASSAAELRDALSATVGTPFRVHRGELQVAAGTLGTNEVIALPAGDYQVQLESTPPREVPIRLASEENLTLVFQREAGVVSNRRLRAPAGYRACAPALEAALPHPAPAPFPAAAASEPTPLPAPAPPPVPAANDPR